MDALAGLDLDFRTVITACDIVGMSMEETAELLDLPPGTVKSRLHRARATAGAATRPGARHVSDDPNTDIDPPPAREGQAQAPADLRSEVMAQVAAEPRRRPRSPAATVAPGAGGRSSCLCRGWRRHRRVEPGAARRQLQVGDARGCGGPPPGVQECGTVDRRAASTPSRPATPASCSSLRRSGTLSRRHHRSRRQHHASS